MNKTIYEKKWDGVSLRAIAYTCSLQILFFVEWKSKTLKPLI